MKAYKDQALTNEMTDQDQAYLNPNTGNLKIKLDQLPSVTIYLKAVTAGTQYGYRKIVMTVQCGAEKISAITATKELAVTQEPTAKTKFDSSLKDPVKFGKEDGLDLLGAFAGASNVDTACPVTSVELYYKKISGDNTLSKWTDTSKVRLNGNYLELFSNSEMFSQRLYVVAKTASGRDGIANPGMGGTYSGYYWLDVEVFL